MKELKYVEIIVEVLVVVLLVACILLVPINKEVNYWISFVFVLLSIIVYMVILQKLKNKEEFLYMIVPGTSFVITMLQMIWNLFVVCAEFIRLESLYQLQGATIFKGTWFQEIPLKQMISFVSTLTNSDIKNAKVITVSVPLNIVINLLLWIVYIVIIYIAAKGANEIQNQRETVKESTLFMKTLEDDIYVLLSKGKLDKSLKPRLLDLAEKVKYSDPVSTESVQQIEIEIRGQFEYLCTNIVTLDIEKAKMLIEELSEKINERNIYCKRGKG